MLLPSRWLHSRYLGPALIGLFMLAHMLVAPFIELGVDEAHYALYGLHPDWSYFDHPPMVGWLHWLGLQGGQTEWFVRLPAMLLWPFILLQIWSLTLRWYADRRVANLAVALLVFSPLIVVLGFGLVPDTPMIAVTLLVIGLVERIDSADGQQLWQWLELGLLLGLAGLSKYTAVFVVVGLLIAMMRYRHSHWLKGLGPWLCACVAALVVTPVFYWNWTHDWMSFSYQVGHGASGRWQLLDTLRYAIILLVSFGPVLVVPALLAIRIPARDTPFATAKLVLLLSALLLLLVALWSAGNGENLPHWTVMSWVLLAPQAAHWLVAKLDSTQWVGALVVLGAGAVSVLLSFALWCLLIAPPIAYLPVTVNAVRDLHGWSKASSKALQLQSEMPGSHLWVSNWTLGSRLAWYSKRPVQVVSGKPSQFLLWWGQPETPAILVRVDKSKPIQSTVKAPEGVACSIVDSLDYQIDGITVNYFSYYRCF